MGRPHRKGPLVWRSRELDARAAPARLPRRRPRAQRRWTERRSDPRYVALYWDIVENRRIVYTYEMLLDDKRISVSLTSVELEPDGAGTRLRLTEHGAFFDGHEPAAKRTDGVGSLLDALGAELERGPA